jgi:hypothetical protein
MNYATGAALALLSLLALPLCSVVSAYPASSYQAPSTTTTTTNIMSTGGANSVAYSGGAATITIEVVMTVPSPTGTFSIIGSTTLTKNATTPAEAAIDLCEDIQEALNAVGSTARVACAGRTVVVSGGASTTGTLASPIETPHTPSEAYGRTVSYTP